jgi:DNA-binding MarR family transcriptional regulator
MEKQHLISRERSVTDERNVYIRLTSEGIELKQKALSIPDQIGKCISISTDEALFLHKTLHKILISFKNPTY